MFLNFLDDSLEGCNVNQCDMLIYVCNVKSNTHTHIINMYTMFAKPECRMRVSFWTYWQPSTFDIGPRVRSSDFKSCGSVGAHGWAERASLLHDAERFRRIQGHFNLDIIFGYIWYPMQPATSSYTTDYYRYISIMSRSASHRLKFTVYQKV